METMVDTEAARGKTDLELNIENTAEHNGPIGLLPTTPPRTWSKLGMADLDAELVKEIAALSTNDTRKRTWSPRDTEARRLTSGRLAALWAAFSCRPVP